MSKIIGYLNDESGASAAEYALILAIIGTSIGVAMFTLGGTIKNAISNASNCVASPSTC